MSVNAKTALSKVAEPVSLEVMLKSAVVEFSQVLPKGMSPERLTRIALTSVRTTPDLAKCTPESFVGSLMVLAQLGLEPVAGRAYLLPFKNNRKIGNDWVSMHEVQAIVGYKGLADLFYRNEKAISLNWGVVCENDTFDYCKGTDSFLKHKKAFKNRGEVVAYWVEAKMKNGGTSFEVMSAEECMAHGRQHSKTWISEIYDKQKRCRVPCEPHFAESSPWHTDPESMCLKTVLIQLCKVLPLSIEMQKALAIDETSREYRKGIGDAMDFKDNTAWKEGKTIDAEVGEAKPSQDTPKTSQDASGDIQDAKPNADKSKPEKQPTAHPEAKQGASEGEEDANEATITLGNVNTKSGKSARGEWKRYFAQGDDGEWYQTFSSTIGQDMESAEGQKVLIKYKIEKSPKGESRNVLAIELADSAEGVTSTNDDDSLPVD